MAELLILVVIFSVLALVLVRVRTGRLHFRVADWPLGKQVEAGLALLFAGAALLGALAGEYAFASWLGLMAAVVCAFAVLTWPRSD